MYKMDTIKRKEGVKMIVTKLEIEPIRDAVSKALGIGLGITTALTQVNEDDPIAWALVGLTDLLTDVKKRLTALENGDDCPP